MAQSTTSPDHTKDEKPASPTAGPGPTAPDLDELLSLFAQVAAAVPSLYNMGVRVDAMRARLAGMRAAR